MYKIGFGRNALYGTKKVIEVVSENDFVEAISNNENCTIKLLSSLYISKKHTFKKLHNILIEGSKDVTIFIPQNCTIKIKESDNIVLKNLTFEGYKFSRKNGEISLQFVDCKDCIVDHCTFLDGEDEQLCIKGNSDYFTISNCKFIHSIFTGHAYSILIGRDKDDKPESDEYHITFYQCYFDGGAARKPRFRNSLVHLLNCYWGPNIIQYLIGPENSIVFLDSCFIQKNDHAKVFRSDFSEGSTYKLRYENTILWHGKNKHNIPESDKTIELPDYKYKLLTIDKLKENIEKISGNI